MFNKTIQEIKCERDYYEEEVIEKLPNQNKDNCDSELVLVITYKQNYFKVYPYNNNFRDKFFVDYNKARKYFESISKK